MELVVQTNLTQHQHEESLHHGIVFKIQALGEVSKVVGGHDGVPRFLSLRIREASPAAESETACLHPSGIHLFEQGQLVVSEATAKVQDGEAWAADQQNLLLL